MKIKVVYYNIIDNERPAIMDIEADDNNETFHKLLKCNTIDIVRRGILTNYYQIIVDDEGLFRENRKVSAISLSKGYCPLVGNLIICKSQGEDLIGLTDDEARIICDCGFVEFVPHPILVLTR